MSKFLEGEIKNSNKKENYLYYYNHNIDTNKLIKNKYEIDIDMGKLYDFIDNNDIILYLSQHTYKIYSKSSKNYLNNNLLNFKNINNTYYPYLFNYGFYLLKNSKYILITNSSNIIILSYLLTDTNITFTFYHQINLVINNENFISKEIHYRDEFDYDKLYFKNEHIYEKKNEIYCFKKNYYFIIDKIHMNNNQILFQLKNKVLINNNNYEYYINYEIYKNKIYFLYKNDTNEYNN